jgi:tripartite-type tricarboxylate transporter receptor subunit TctC
MKETTMTSWVIMIGPRGLPTEVLSRRNAAINQAIAEPEVKERLLKGRRRDLSAGDAGWNRRVAGRRALSLLPG